MPDYLGKDQRKIKDDEKKDDKPIQALDEGDIEILKTYVSTSKCIAFMQSVTGFYIFAWLDMLCFITGCIQEICLGSVSISLA